MFVKGMFENNEKVTANFYNKVETISNGEVSFSYPALTLSVEALFWAGSFVDKYVSERFRADVTGIIVIDYDDYSYTVGEDAIVTIDNTDYSIVYVDNVANQNKVIQIPVKRFS